MMPGGTEAATGWVSHMRDPLAALECVCRQARLGPLGGFRFQRAGSVHATWRISTQRGDFAIRLGSAREAAAVRQQDLSMFSPRIAPRRFGRGVVKVEGRAFHYTVMEWLHGRRFDYSRDLRRLAVTLSCLHRATCNRTSVGFGAASVEAYLSSQLQDYSRRPAGTSAMAGRLGREAAAAWAGLPAPRAKSLDFTCLAHNDLVAENIIIVGERARLIDWDWAVNSHPALDLCGFLSPFVTSWKTEHLLGRRAVSVFLGTYMAPFSQADRRMIGQRLVDVWSAYNAAAACWLCYRSPVRRPHFTDDGFFRRGFDRSAEMREWLRQAASS